MAAPKREFGQKLTENIGSRDELVDDLPAPESMFVPTADDYKPHPGVTNVTNVAPKAPVSRGVTIFWLVILAAAAGPFIVWAWRWALGLL